MKRFLSVVAVLVTSVLLFSACNTTTKLTFTAYWARNKTDPAKFEETCVYDIVYRSDFNITVGNYSYNFTAELPENCEIVYGAGSYTTKTETPVTLPPAATDSNISAGEDKVYRITMTFELPVSYTFKGETDADNKTYNFTDRITSEVYFKNHANSLSPLYSIKTYDTTDFRSNIIRRYAYQTEVKWNNGRAQLIIKDLTETKTEPTPDDNYRLITVDNSDITIKYKEGTVLDNEELLFSVRGMNLAENFNRTVGIFDTAYKSLQNTTVSCIKIEPVTDPWSLKIGTTESNYTNTSTFFTTIIRSNSTYSGTATLCYYQIMNYEGEDETVTAESNARGWLIKMVTKLPNSLGALEYRLKSVEITES